MARDLKLSTLKVIVFASLLEDSIEDIRGTDLYKQGIKNQCNKLVEMLKPHVAEIETIYNKSPEFTTNIMRNIEEFVTKLSDENVVDFVMMNQIHDTYNKDKENWQNLMDIEFKELQK